MIRLPQLIAARPFALALLTAAAIFCAAASSVPPAITLPNLALGKPATASGSRGRSLPANAVDDNPRTSWSNAQPKTACWWCVDLGDPVELGGGEIRWDRGDFFYQYALEGSLDGDKWFMLNDQRGTDFKGQLHRLAIPPTRARFVRITVNKLEKGDWTTFSEFRLFAADAMKTLPDDVLSTFLETAPPYQNHALDKKALASSTEGERAARSAIDGDLGTRWCASDGSKPQWWMVDLGGPEHITDIEVFWESARAYRSVVEGSPDGVEWRILGDGRNNILPIRRQLFPAVVSDVRFIRITVTGVSESESTWASISEVRVLDKSAPVSPPSTKPAL